MAISNYSSIRSLASSSEPLADIDPCSITVFSNNKIVKCYIESLSNNIILKDMDGERLIAQIKPQIDDTELQRLSEIFFSEFNGDYLVAKKLLDWVVSLIHSADESITSSKPSRALLPKPLSFLTCKMEMVKDRPMAVVQMIEGKKEPIRLSARMLYQTLRYNKKMLTFDPRFEFDSLVEQLEKIVGTSTAEKTKELIESYSKPPLTNSQYITNLLAKAVKGDRSLFNSQGFCLNSEYLDLSTSLHKRSCISEELILRNIKNILPPST